MTQQIIYTEQVQDTSNTNLITLLANINSKLGIANSGTLVLPVSNINFLTTNTVKVTATANGTGSVNVSLAVDSANTGVSFPLLAPFGNVAAPSYSFNTANTTGIFGNGAAISFAVLGLDILDFGIDGANNNYVHSPRGLRLDTATGFGTIVTVNGVTVLNLGGSTNISPLPLRIDSNGGSGGGSSGVEVHATTTTSANSGSATALPANPVGYLDWFLNGNAIRIPYYNT